MFHDGRAQSAGLTKRWDGGEFMGKVRQALVGGQVSAEWRKLVLVGQEGHDGAPARWRETSQPCSNQVNLPPSVPLLLARVSCTGIRTPC